LRPFRLSKSRIVSGLHCPRRLWLTVHRPELEVASPESERRVAAGVDVGEVARGLYPGGVLVGDGGPLMHALRETDEALGRAGDFVLYEATFRHAGVLVRADILERRDGRLRMIEVKSSTRLKEHHLPDVAIQAWTIEGTGLQLDVVNLAVIDTDFLYRGDGEYGGLLKEIPVADQVRPLMAQVPGWVRGLNDVLAGPLPTITHGPQCRRPFDCPFMTWCDEQAGRRRASFVPPSIEPPDPALGVVDARAAEYLAALPYPRAYLDFETVQFAVPVWAGTRPYQQCVFQWSLHVEREPGVLEHHAFLDTSGRPPMRPAAEALLAAAGRDGPIFVYHDFEKWRLLELAAMEPDLASALEGIMGRLVDLYRLTREHYEHPALRGSYSLKSVLPTVDPELDHAQLDEIRDGLSAQGAYHEAIAGETDPERRDQLRACLLEYCALDTLALVRLAHALEGRRRTPQDRTATGGAA
jgi:hypothetical protein